MADLTLVLGGAKSGKTAFALKKAEEHQAPRLYLATAQALDPEMGVRIKNHQAERGPDWRTIEAPLDPAGAIAAEKGRSVILLDCLTLWFNNLLGQDETLDLNRAKAEITSLAEAIAAYGGPVIAVSNEVGWGIVPINDLARKFRDITGLAHQMLAAQARDVFLVAAGLPLKLK